ncbi:hypothetical protein M3Y99_00952100 [Aphelenchoides fujianensis]|nr:hypothetical protein M3Y99_00952100 [Aphelenchoides fujianensis]
MSPFLRRLLSLLLVAVFLFFVFFELEHVPTHVVEKYAEKFCVVYNFTIAEGLSTPHPYEPISLALHSTMSYARYLVEQADTWDDFISYALFIEPRTQHFFYFVHRLWHCDERVREKTSLHLVWELTPFQRECTFDPEMFSFNGSCEGFYRKNAFPMMAASVLVYPINYLRNIARRGAGTRLHIVADMENIFSGSFASMVRNETELMLRKHPHEKYVLVYRRFELVPGLRKPKDIPQLWTLLKGSRATFFHSKYFPLGHFIPGLHEWLRYSADNTDVISIPVRYYSAGWEPQFIMPAEAPFHYEEVPTRRYDHQVLVRELCRADYSFRVLSHVFNIHVGWKTNHTHLEMVVHRVSKYDPHYGSPDFQQYLERTYPETRGSCPRLR